MWKVTWLCSFFLVLSGYCFAKVIEAPSTCDPEKTINAELVPIGANMTSGPGFELCKNSFPSRNVVRAEYVYMGWRCFVDFNDGRGPLFYGHVSGPSAYVCPDGFNLNGTQCIKPKTCKCPNDTEWVLGSNDTYCYKDNPDDRADYCKERADSGYDVKLGVTQGGCFNVGGLPAAQGCFYAYKDRVCIISGVDGTSIADCGPGVENTGVLCTIDKETDPEDPEKPKPGDSGSESSNPDGEGKGDGDGDGKGDGDKGNGEASSGEGEGNGGTGGNGNSEDGGTCPAWAKAICDAFGWDAGKPADVDTSNLPGNGGSGAGGDSIDVGQWDTSDRFMGAGSCPAPKLIEFEIANHVSRFELTYEPICQFVGMVRYVLMIIAMIVGARIVFSTKT